MVADARAIDMADLADAAEEGAAIVINATMAEVEAIASRLVPDETIRAAVMVRLAERSDLVPWARPFWFDDDKEEDDKEETAHTVMLALVLALKPGPNGAFAWRGLSLDDLSKDDGLASHVAWNLFQDAIDAFIPPADRDAVADVIDRHPGPPADSYTPMEPSGPSSGPLADDWHWQPVPLGTARLVAWFSLQETTTPRLAEHATRAILAEVKDDTAARPDARRTLAREVEDHLEEWASTIAAEETIDEALAGFLERIGGGAAKKAAADVRQSSAKRSEAEKAARWAPGAEPLRVARLLARALWADVVAVVLRGDMEQEAHARERREKVPAPTMHPAPRSAIMSAPLGSWRTNRDGSLETGDVDKRRGYLPPVAMVSVGERALSSSAGKIVPTLAALLSREAWDRWVRGVDRFDWIAVPAGRNALHARGIDATEDELDEAIAWLQDLKVGGLPCIDASPPPQEVMGDERHGGRPEKRRIVRVGAPLAPMGLESVYRDAGMVLPPELRFFSPVLDPAEAPLIGHRQTYARQRDFYALGIGSFFVEHREQYAERGGVKIDLQAWRRCLDARGIYHRSHHSLADQMWDAYRGHRKPGLPGIGPRAAVLVETAPGSGVYRLGPDFAEQERVIMNAAEKTAKRRRDARKRGAAKRRSQTDS